ncbi:MAG: OmpA family protein [Prevotellaceae bacterium]|nr:OmpA family protein [Prevotellaceae bacterium]
MQRPKPLRRDVFFTINKSVIEEAQEGKVAEIAAYLTKHPDAKVTITGYADAGTGTKAINARLAGERAKAVADALTAGYGIDEGRITYSGKGDTEQPFSWERHEPRVHLHSGMRRKDFHFLPLDNVKCCTAWSVRM